MVLAEIRQTSDITYRIYDFDRVDDEGKERELHTELAIDALNFSNEINAKRTYKKDINTLNEVVNCIYFNTNFISIVGIKEIDYSQTDSFVIFICVEGSANITIFSSTETIELGETILIPAIANNVIITAENCKLLEVTV